jgi:uncharacterized protein (TIRG00374 family)
LSDEAPTSGGARKAWLWLPVRIGVAGGLLAWAIHAALPSDGARALRDALPGSAGEAALWLALGFALFGANLALGAARFGLMLRGAGLRSSWPVLFRAYLVATFFNTVLPGAVMGDVYRVVDARHEAGSGSAVLGVVVLERLLGLAALGTLALIAAPAIAQSALESELAGPLIAFSGLFVVLPLLVLQPTLGNAALRLCHRFDDLPLHIAERLERGLGALAALRARPALIAQSFGLSLVCQGLPVLAVIALAQPLASEVPWYWFAVIVPFVTLVSLLPVSIGGLGVREVLYVSLFGQVGMTPAAALALALGVLVLTLAWAGVGFVVFAAGRGGWAQRAGTRS